MLIKHTRTFAIPFLQRQKYQYHVVVRINTGRAEMRSASINTSFFFRVDRLRQLAQLHIRLVSYTSRKSKISVFQVCQFHRLYPPQLDGMKYNQQLDWQNESSKLLFPIPSNSSALQLVQNGVYKTKHRDSARLVIQKMCFDAES